MSRPSRPYNSAVRAQQAEATRQSILRAARRLFAETGYQATTIDAIAGEAEVSTPTVYVAFKSKRRILAELVATAVSQPDIRRVADSVVAETDPEKRIRGAARVMRRALEAEAELIDVIWQAGTGDADLVDAWRQSHANRHRRLTEVFGPILPARGDRRFIELAWVCGSPETYRLLVEVNGWTPRQYEAWLADVLLDSYRAAKRPSSG